MDKEETNESPKNEKGIEHLIQMQEQLIEKLPDGLTLKSKHHGSIVAGLGIIEETLEYLNSIGYKNWRPNPLSRERQLEEITDILFFYLELIVVSGFSWSQIEERYHAKHAKNLERYRLGEKGDYSWDDRATKKEL